MKLIDTNPDQSMPSIILKMILPKKVLGTELFNISIKNPERHCHQPYRRQLLYQKYRHDQNDRLYHQPRSLLLSESGKDTSYENIMPEVENQDDTEFKATRKLRAFNDTPVTSSSSFKQEFLHRLDKIKCMAKLLLSRSQTPPRTGFRNQPLNWRGLFL